MIGSCIVIGDLNIDLILTGLKNFPQLGREVVTENYYVDIGGSGGIFATVLSQLGIKTYIISKIGNDFFGNLLLNKLKSYGVNIDRVVVVDSEETGEETGITVTLSYKSDKSQISCLDLIGSLNLGEIVFGNIEGVRHVHFTSYYMMGSLKTDYVKLIDEIKKSYPDVTFSFDANDDPSDMWNGDEIYKVLSNVEIFFANKKEALKITNKADVEGALEKLGKEVKTVVIKLGSDGYIAKHGEDYYSGRALSVDFKDSTGAGDNFDAGFIYGYLSGLGIRKSLEIANICGAKSVEYMGGVGSIEKFSKIRGLIGMKY